VVSAPTLRGIAVFYEATRAKPSGKDTGLRAGALGAPGEHRPASPAAGKRLMWELYWQAGASALQNAIEPPEFTILQP
jgi:hypothetical protein